ncbi:hypothetical protein CP532_1839 [Ophiocordyceps camponoti-leonardi (nom. inval.)]|nr:hypothetical protein CP532_1839 [Ophiocordyceps camponoti-leonardi (nom. inval.)]
MKYNNSLLLIGLVARSSTASPQAGSGAVTDKIAPQGGAPDGCQSNAPGRFQVRTQRLSDAVIPNQQSATSCDSDKSLVLTLNDGVLNDVKGRVGYVASNYQFQFDGPPQAGSIYTAGFALCGNGSVALGPSTVFYQCLSGTFYNLYDRNWAAQCEPIFMMAMPCDAGSGSGGAAALGAGGELSSSSSSSAPVGELGDGQPESSVRPPAPIVSQIGDGQPQAPVHPPAPVVSEIGDGQPQAPYNPQQPNGPQQPNSPQQPSAPVVSQIGDGQPQAPYSPQQPPQQSQSPAQPAAPVVSEIGDGQPQAPYNPQQPEAPSNPQQPEAPVVSQIGDGQPQAPTGGSNAPPAAETPAAGPGAESGSSSPASEATSAPAAPSSGQDQAPASPPSSSSSSTQPAYEVSQGVRMVLPGVATVMAMAVAGGLLIL